MNRRASLFALFAIAFLAMMFLVQPFASSAPPEHSRAYDPGEKKVTFAQNSNGQTVAEMRLTSALIENVIDRGPGIMQPVAQIEFSGNPSALNAFKGFDDMELYDVKRGMAGFSRAYEWRYAVEETYAVPEFETTCTAAPTPENSSAQDCTTSQIGSTDHTRITNWVKVEKLSQVPSGSTLALFVDVQPGETIEWIPTFLGHRVPEWAQWTEGFNQGILGYWTFNSTGDDSLGKNNLSVPSSWPPGIINDSVNLGSITLGDKTDLRFEGYTGATINLWAKRTGAFQTYDYWISQSSTQGPSANGDFRIHVSDGSNANGVEIDIHNGSTRFANIESGNFPLDQWAMITFLINTTDVQILMNGSLSTSQNINGFAFNSINLSFWQEDSGTGYQVENILWDEMAIWNRTLSSLEISSLYNEHLAITYDPNPDSTAPNVTIARPLAEETTKFVEVNITRVDDVGVNTTSFNVTKIDGTIEIAETTLAAGSNTTVNLTGNGNYVIWVKVNDTIGNTNITNRSFSVNMSVPNITINSPSGTVSSLSVAINASVFVSSPYGVDYCYFNITRGASTEIENTRIENCQNTTATVSGDATYTLNVWANATSGGANWTNQSFTVSTSSGDSGEGGGGGSGGGGATTIVESGNKLWRMTAFPSGGSYRIGLAQGETATREIILQNLGTEALEISLRCEGDLCEFLTLRETSVELPVGVDVAKSVKFDVEIPQDLEDGTYTANIFGNAGIEAETVITVSVTVGPLGQIVAALGKMFAAKDFGKFKVPYFLMMIMVGGAIVGGAVLSGARGVLLAISVIGGFLASVLLLFFI